MVLSHVAHGKSGERPSRWMHVDGVEQLRMQPGPQDAEYLGRELYHREDGIVAEVSLQRREADDALFTSHLTPASNQRTPPPQFQTRVLP